MNPNLMEQFLGPSTQFFRFNSNDINVVVTPIDKKTCLLTKRNLIATTATTNAALAAVQNESNSSATSSTSDSYTENLKLIKTKTNGATKTKKKSIQNNTKNKNKYLINDNVNILLDEIETNEPDCVSTATLKHSIQEIDLINKNLNDLTNCKLDSFHLYMYLAFITNYHKLFIIT